MNPERMIGELVNSDCGIWGVVEYLTPDGYFGVRGPYGRLDEIEVHQVWVDPT